MLSKNDGVTSYSTIISLSESPVARGRRVGRHRRWQRAGEPGRRGDVHRGRQEPAGPAGEPRTTGSRASTRRTSTPGPRTSRSTVIATTISSRTSSSRATTARRWQSIASNLPQFGNIQVVREDPKNRDLLYVGTEFGLFISMDGGKSWQKFMNNLPTARVDDILVHPRDNDLIVATHARGVWIVDDITPLQQLTPAVAAAGRRAVRRPAGGGLAQRSAGRAAGRPARSTSRRESAARRVDQLLPEERVGAAT